MTAAQVPHPPDAGRTYNPSGGSGVTLIAVSGACSRAGKTALLETLLRALPSGEAAALKFTTTDDVFERCPRGAPCVVCDIDVPFRLITDTPTLRQPGTDTDRLAAAGAARVLWAVAKRHAVAAAWQAARRELAGAPHVVMEGSTVVELASPELLLFVAHPHLSPERWKPTSAALVARADAVVVNLTDPARAPAPEVLEALRGMRGRDDLLLADVQRPLREWAPGIQARLLAPLGACRA